MGTLKETLDNLQSGRLVKKYLTFKICKMFEKKSIIYIIFEIVNTTADISTIMRKLGPLFSIWISLHVIRKALVKRKVYVLFCSQVFTRPLVNDLRPQSRPHLAQADQGEEDWEAEMEGNVPYNPSVSATSK